MSASLSTEQNRNEENQAPCTNAFNQAENLKVKPNDSASNMLLSSSTSLPPSLGHVQSSASTPPSQTTCKSFTVPKTSGQFQADWRSLQKDPEQLFHYFKVRLTWIDYDNVCISLLPPFASMFYRLQYKRIDSSFRSVLNCIFLKALNLGILNYFGHVQSYL